MEKLRARDRLIDGRKLKGGQGRLCGVKHVSRSERAPRIDGTAAPAGVELAVVHGPETIAIADAIAILIAGTAGFSCRRFGYQADAIKPCSASDETWDGVDVVVATLSSSQAKDFRSVFASLAQAFPARAIVVVPAEPDALDLFEMLEIGASDFLLPPLRASELVPRLRRQVRMARRSDAGVQDLKRELGLKQIVGASPVFLSEVQRIPRFAKCDAPVLLSGESGTGKEIFARALHYLSPRADRPFVPVNCGALPEHLVESEIFGHKRGAFTGATTDQAGLICEAEGGTLFLDEIDALTRPSQVKLLRFLQDGEHRPVGSQKIVHADVRVIAAANADFNGLVREGRFREDLFYRLSVLTLRLPPLRERPGDILLLAQHFLERLNAADEGSPKHLSLAALNCLFAHSWPGNVRELQNVLTRASVLAMTGTIELADLGLIDETAPAERQSFQTMKSRAVSRFEHDLLQSVLRAHDGNITRAASSVKKNRRAFWELLRKHGLLEGCGPNEKARGG